MRRKFNTLIDYHCYKYLNFDKICIHLLIENNRKMHYNNRWLTNVPGFNLSRYIIIGEELLNSFGLGPNSYTNCITVNESKVLGAGLYNYSSLQSRDVFLARKKSSVNLKCLTCNSYWVKKHCCSFPYFEQFSRFIIYFFLILFSSSKHTIYV